jgi:hypothetical protein
VLLNFTKMRTQKNNTETKDSFVFYRSYFEALSDLPEEQQFKLYFAISNYSLNFIEPKFNGICKTVWTLIKPQIDANRKKWQDGKKSKKGGRPRKEKPTGFISENPNENVNDNVNENNNENVNVENHSQFLEFHSYKTTYTDLPIELQDTIQSNDWQTWQTFNQHIDKECKRIRQIPEQLNYTDYLEYRDRYIKSCLIDTLKLKSMLSKFNNCKSINTYISVYHALIDWTEREITYLKVV